MGYHRQNYFIERSPLHWNTETGVEILELVIVHLILKKTTVFHYFNNSHKANKFKSFIPSFVLAGSNNCFYCATIENFGNIFEDFIQARNSYHLFYIFIVPFILQISFSRTKTYVPIFRFRQWNEIP